MPIIRSISGLRATLSDFLTPEVISKYVLSFSYLLPEGPIVVGRDGRPSGQWIEQVIVGSLISAGREVFILGTAPTPTVQLMTELSEAVGGIAITASHNPKEWNGLKFIDSNGVFLDIDANSKLWEHYDNFKFLPPSSDIYYKSVSMMNAIDDHIDNILTIPVVSNGSFIQKLADKRYKVVVDAVNASGSVAIPLLLRKLGCQVIPLHCDGSGVFPHAPEPLTENLIELAQAVKNNKADLGIAVDPDADRLVLIDENGEAIGEEKTICLAIEAVLSNFSAFEIGVEPSVVVNLSTTRLAKDIADKYLAKFHRSPVGEINVIKKMIEVDAVVGGEGSGGVILPTCHYGRDSLVGTALILFLMVKRNQTLSQIVDSMPKYHMIKYKQNFSGSFAELIEKAKAEFPEAEINLEDGIRIDFAKSWVQMRTSNTEPIIRIIAEAPELSEAQNLIHKLKSLI
jgi:phosphomannomutase